MAMLERFRGTDLPMVTDMLDSFFGNTPRLLREEASSVPRVNVSETDDKYKIEVAAPGLSKEDLHLDLDGDILTISAEKEEKHEDKAENGNYTRREFSYTSFSRSFTLPENANADKIDAQYKDGILNITIPKKEEKKQKSSKNIKIK